MYLIRVSKKTHNFIFHGLFKEPSAHKFISQKMKSLLLLAIIFVASQTITMNHELKVYYGQTNDWLQKGGQQLHIHVDYSNLNLKNPPFVTLFLSCNSFCPAVMGVTNISNLTNKGFTVYLVKSSKISAWRAMMAGLVVHYKIEEQ